jgi:hypothetical protein
MEMQVSSVPWQHSADKCVPRRTEKHFLTKVKSKIRNVYTTKKICGKQHTWKKEDISLLLKQCDVGLFIQNVLRLII